MAITGDRGDGRQQSVAGSGAPGADAGAAPSPTLVRDPGRSSPMRATGVRRMQRPVRSEGRSAYRYGTVPSRHHRSIVTATRRFWMPKAGWPASYARRKAGRSTPDARQSWSRCLSDQEARGLRRFLLRGLAKVNGEWLALGTTHNLNKPWPPPEETEAPGGDGNGIEGAGPTPEREPSVADRLSLDDHTLKSARAGTQKVPS